MGETWDAVIDLFATRLIPIRTIERVSGLIATEGLGVDSADGLAWADCGRRGRRRYEATNAIYNVLVRGDSTRATVRTTVRWSHTTEKVRIPECTSTNVWERGLEQEVKQRAEAAHIAALFKARHSAADPRTSPAPIESSPEGSSARSAPTSPAPARATPNRAPGSPWSAGQARTNDQLLESVGFRHAISDVHRLEIVAGYRELRPDTLTVELDDAAFTSASAEHNLARLYLAYRETTHYSSEGVLELRHDGRRVGWYTRGGLTWEAVR
jgi:transposase